MNVNIHGQRKKDKKIRVFIFIFLNFDVVKTPEIIVEKKQTNRPLSKLSQSFHSKHK